MARSQIGPTIDRIRRQLDASVRLETNVLAVNCDASESPITLTYDLSPSTRTGSILNIGLELMRVISVNTGSKECTVLRGWVDSEGAAHTLGDEVLINPRFSRWDILQAIIAEVESWAPDLFKAVSYQTTVTDDDESFELSAEHADALGVIALHRQWTEDADVTSWPTLPYRLLRGTVGTWSGASTSGLRVRVLPQDNTLRNGTVHVVLAKPFDLHTDPPTEASDLIDDYGLDQSLLELVELGVKMRLVGDQEIGRSARGQQDEPRRSEETPPGAALNVSQTFRGQYMRRRGDEVRKLRAKYKMRAW